jgi:thioredoxin 1
VDFTAKWCGPCAQVGPYFEELCALYGEKLQFVKIDVDESEVRAELLS